MIPNTIGGEAFAGPANALDDKKAVDRQERSATLRAIGLRGTWGSSHFHWTLLRNGLCGVCHLLNIEVMSHDVARAVGVDRVQRIVTAPVSPARYVRLDLWRPDGLHADIACDPAIITAAPGIADRSGHRVGCRSA